MIHTEPEILKGVRENKKKWKMKRKERERGVERESRWVQTDSQIEGLRLVGMVSLILTSVTDLSLSLVLLHPQAVLSLVSSRHLLHHHFLSLSLLTHSELHVHSSCFRLVSSSVSVSLSSVWINDELFAACNLNSWLCLIKTTQNDDGANCSYGCHFSGLYLNHIISKGYLQHYNSAWKMSH